MKNISTRYEINRLRLGHDTNALRYKMCHSIIKSICIRQRLKAD